MFTDTEGRLRPLWAFILSASLACVAFLVTAYLASAIAGDHILRFEAIFRPLLAAILLATFSWLLTVGNHVETHRIAAQGFPVAPGWIRQFCAGCGLAFLLVLAVVISVAAWDKLAFRTTVNLHSLTRCLVVLLVLLTGSLAEELMFRGYPFQRLVEAIGKVGAIVVVSVLFGVVHLSNPGASLWGLINTVAIGVLLSVAYLRTRALWLPWGFHFAWNATLGLILGFPVSGYRLFNVAVRANVTGPRWMTGASYGPEASLPGALAVVIGMLVIWRAPLRPLSASKSLSDECDGPDVVVSNPSN
jgi:hypothetical protein